MILAWLKRRGLGNAPELLTKAKDRLAYWVGRAGVRARALWFGFAGVLRQKGFNLTGDPKDQVTVTAAGHPADAPQRTESAAGGTAGSMADKAPRRAPLPHTPMATGAAFEERRSRTLRHAETYSRFVRTLKVLLPVSAFAVIAAMMLFAVIYKPDDSLTVSFSSIERIDNDLRMVNPRFSGVDDERRPFLVTAEAAIQDPENQRSMTLESLQADMTLSETTWVSVNADHGFLDMDAETLTLEGGIDVFSDTGYEFHMEHAVISFEDHSVLSETAVEGQGPLGTLRADRFMAEDQGQNLRFEGNVRMRIFPPARSPAPTPAQDSE